MIELFFLAVALSMDAFAVSIGLGSKRVANTRRQAAVSALYFGLFQALMPLIGFVGGKGILGWIDGYAHWVAFGLLALIGAKMIYESISEGIEEDITQITHKVMLILAIATSIDAMAAGFTLNLLEVNAFFACAVIGIVTSVFSWFGVFIGFRSGTQLESKAELLGGLTLILIGLKIALLP